MTGVGESGIASPRVSVVIPHLNQPEQLARCLASLDSQTVPRAQFEVIVVDNGSSCDLDALARAHPGISLLSEPTPGPGPARNRGIAAACAPVLAFIDADCRAHPGWLEAALAGLDAPACRGVVGGDVRIDAVDPRRLTPLEAYESVFAFRQKLYIERHGYSGTGNLAFRRPVHDEVGPFGGIGIAEDMDWGRRAGAVGRGAVYQPSMIVYHPARRSFSELQAKWRRHVAHQLEAHRLGRRPLLLWWLKAGAVALSAFPHALAMLSSDRVHGLRNRLKGLPVLFRIRLWRAGEMLRQAGASETAAASWNRTD